jgi:hypothetical protein
MHMNCIGLVPCHEYEILKNNPASEIIHFAVTSAGGLKSTVESGYNSTDLCDTSSIALNILGYQLIAQC